MNITVIGCGRWGSFIGWYLDQIGHKVSFYGPADTPHMQRYLETRTNGMITLRDSIGLLTDLPEALKAETVVISVPSQSFRGLLHEILDTGVDISKKSFILCMKGIEIESGKRLSEVFEEVIGPEVGLAVWLGPGHPQEFVKGIPNCMVIDSKSEALKEKLVNEFKGPLIRFYYGSDLIGNEIGGASKNVIGIAAGVLDGIGRSSLKGALMSRGTHEISKLIEACGGKALSAYGLCHLGDYEATVFSKFSHNRAFGEMFAKGESFPDLAEGYYTAKAIHKLAQEKGVELPICDAVYAMLYENADIEEGLNALFLRSLKQEF
ncbi:MAG: NAD(P)H-dependent glycerol-3-phosphate dehydrogenase [Clostridia bacterium]|nr:NAD(P)H-dependent glycerol-3-phosphate dehydrogenase [Clostridia bacterium]